MPRDGVLETDEPKKPDKNLGGAKEDQDWNKYPLRANSKCGQISSALLCVRGPRNIFHFFLFQAAGPITRAAEVPPSVGKFIKYLSISPIYE